MATATPRVDDLRRSLDTVRHPLTRVRGIIRRYVALEAFCLLALLLALWFWVGLALDYGAFAGLGVDWVQEAFRPARALFLGVLFLGAIFIARAGLIMTLAGHEIRDIFRTSFAAGGRRQSLPVWMRWPLTACVVGLISWFLMSGLDVLLRFEGASLSRSLGSSGLAGLWVGVLVALAIPAMHELIAVRSSVTRLLRALFAGLGSAAGAYLGFSLGLVFADDTRVAAVLGAIMAIVGDLSALIVLCTTVLVIRRKIAYVPFTIPIIAVFLLVWFLLGLGADTLTATGSGVLVALLLCGPVLFVWLKRLFRDFSDPALALILERKFPKQLGDRLITAVELSDPVEAVRLGYSSAMLASTIHDAAQRVGTVPVSDAFDWRRLFFQGALVAGLTFGLYFVAIGVFTITPLQEGDPQPIHAGFVHLNEIAGLWVERNVLLMNTIWPRQAHLEVMDWPESGELFVGRDQAAPALRIRALKWVIADPGTPEGWRRLSWDDLSARPELLADSSSVVPIPAAWGAPRDRTVGWTIDEVENRLERAETPDPEVPVQPLHDLLKALRARAADPALHRTIRILKVPATVTVAYRGANTSGLMPLDRRGENEYSGSFSDLKESIRFTVRGEDYTTRTLQITVVPTPSLVELIVDEYRPAYMFYRIAGGNDAFLKGKKQLVAGRQISLYGGDTSRIDPVPAGCDLVLTAKSDKELVAASIAPPRKGVPEVKGQVELLDPRTFQVRFDNVRVGEGRPTYDFYFEFTDTDGVRGQRHIVIKPVSDGPPEVDVGAEVVRKTQQGYLVTPTALIPLRIKAVDDFGLSAVEFASTHNKIDRGTEGASRALLALAASQASLGGIGQELAVAARLAQLTRDSKAASSKAETETSVRRSPVAPFGAVLTAARREFWTEAQVTEHLEKNPPEFNLTRFFELIASERDPIRDGEAYFNLQPLGMKADESEIQPRYRLQLWAEAVDNDMETGPHRSPSKEKISFLVVSENELLSEIAKEEETLYVKLTDRVKTLQDALAKVDRMKEDLTGVDLKVEQFDAMALRVEDVLQTIERGETVVNEVMTDYRRILKELIVNRVRQPMIERVDKQICEPLQEIVARDFPRTRDGYTELKKAFEGSKEDAAGRTLAARKSADEARNRHETLIRNLIVVLDKMQQLADINAVIKLIKEIEEEEVRQAGVLTRLKKQLQDKLLEELTGGKP